MFIVDQALRTVEGYTTDEAKLKAAVERVAGTATMPTGRERDALRDSRVRASAVPVTAGAEFAGGIGSGVAPSTGSRSSAPTQAAIGAGEAEAATRQALDRMDRSYRDLQSNIEGQASMNALLALVDSLGALPGTQDRRLLLRGPDGRARGRGEIPIDHRHREPQERQRLRARCRGPARPQQAGRDRARAHGAVHLGGHGHRTERQQEVDRGSRSQRADAEERSRRPRSASSRARPAAC